MNSTIPLLEVRDLEIRFRGGGKLVYAVQGANFSVAAGKRLGIVGESGCGKSTTGLAIMGLLPAGLGWVDSGSIVFSGANLLAETAEQSRQRRGAEIAMIFQDPMSSLNPVMKIGHQIVESLRAHGKVTKRAARQRAETLLAEVGIPSPAAAMRKYPHELSGGMRQRVMIAMAMSLTPKLIIADEPTTALDPTIQAQVLDLLGRLVTDSGSALILITHDFGVIAEMTDEVMVMYAGRIVEKTETAALFAAPQHPYTQSLIHSLPRIDTKVEQLTPIEGSPPALDQRIPGCAFAPRCNRRLPICTGIEPILAASAWSATHWTACHNIQTLQQRPTQVGPDR